VWFRRLLLTFRKIVTDVSENRDAALIRVVIDCLDCTASQARRPQPSVCWFIAWLVG
jgi:hypothetical protein